MSARQLDDRTIRVLRLCLIERSPGTIRFLHSEDGHDPAEVDGALAVLRAAGLIADTDQAQIITTETGNTTIDATGRWEVLVTEFVSHRWSGDRTIVVMQSLFNAPKSGDRFRSSHGREGTVLAEDFHVTQKEGRLGYYLDIEVEIGATLTAMPPTSRGGGFPPKRLQPCDRVNAPELDGEFGSASPPAQAMAIARTAECSGCP